MRILAIETSCDETAISLIEAKKTPAGDVFSILSSHISSQVNIHRPFGGVVPNLAKREHQKNLPIILKKVLKEITPLVSLSLRGKKQEIDIDIIAVTSGPGLEPALWQGITFAQGLSKIWKKPIIAVNHLEGHIYSAFMRGDEFEIPKNIFPLLTLIVSGGHTELVLIKKHLSYKILGETLDDAAGEAFDKVARMLGLPYPGGPEISTLAKKGNPKAINFPRPMINSKDLNFSFSGLKTSVLYKLREFNASENSLALPRNKSEFKFRGARPHLEFTSASTSLADFAASFEQAAVDVLVKKTEKAIAEYRPKTVALGGGVAANDKLREIFAKKFGSLLPEKQFTGDNASMIAVAAYFKALKKKFSKPGDIKANGHLKL